MRTYLVGRKNSRQPCDIEVPEKEESVSRKHLELSVTDDGRYYVVHLHPHNTTEVLRGGHWRRITQDFVEADERLKLGAYETTARHLLGGGSGGGSPRESAPGEDRPFEWDPERGSFKRPGL